MTVTGASKDLTLSSSGGSVNIEATEGATDAIVIDASDTAGGIDIDCGTNGIAVDTTGAFSIDGVGASNISLATSGDASDLTISLSGATDSSILLSSTGTGADAIGLTASAGDIAINSTLGDILNTCGDEFNVTATGLVDINAGGGLDIDVGAGQSISIDIEDQTITDTMGGTISITAGKGLGSGAGGSISNSGGEGGATGNGGFISIGGGAGGSTSGDGGSFYAYGGNGTEGNGGNLQIYAGSGMGATDYNGGFVNIDGGYAVNDGFAGYVNITGGGAGTNGAGGDVNITGGGGGFTTGNAGGVNLDGGIATSGNGGSISITASDAATAGNGGSVDITAGSGTGGGTNGTITLDAGSISIDSTDDSNLTMTSNDAGDKTLTISASNAGAGAGIIDIDADGAITIDSSAGAISVGADAVVQNINIGTGASARTITIGNNASAEVEVNALIVDVNSGGALTLDSTDDSNLTMTANDAGDKTLTIASSNAGAGAGNISLTADNLNVIGDVLMATDDKVQFRDTTIYINSPTDGQMDIFSDGKIYNRGYFDCSKFFHFDDFAGATLAYWTTANVGTGVVPTITAIINGVAQFAVNANNDESSMIWTEAVYDSDQNPVFEWMMRSNTQITNQEIEAGWYVDGNDYLMFAFRTGTDPANIYLVSNNNGAGEVATDTTIDLTVDTYFVFRLELFADDSFKAYINGTQVASGHIGTIRDVAFKPRVWFKGLAAQANTLDLDYCKIWQDR